MPASTLGVLSLVGEVEPGLLFTTYSGIFFIGSAFCANGILASALTAHPLAAAGLSFTFNIALFMVHFFSNLFRPGEIELLWIEHVSAIHHMVDELDSWNPRFESPCLLVHPDSLSLPRHASAGEEALGMSVLTERKNRARKHVPLQIILALWCVFVANAWIFHSSIRSDWTSDGLLTVTESDRELIAALTGSVEVVIPLNLGPEIEDTLKTRVLLKSARWLEELSQVTPNRLQRPILIRVNQEGEKWAAERARRVPALEETDVDRIHFFHDGRRVSLSAEELADFRFPRLEPEGVAEILVDRTREGIESALRRLIREEKIQIRISQGSGEPGLNEPGNNLGWRPCARILNPVVHRWRGIRSPLWNRSLQIPTCWWLWPEGWGHGTLGGCGRKIDPAIFGSRRRSRPPPAWKKCQWTGGAFCPAPESMSVPGWLLKRSLSNRV